MTKPPLGNSEEIKKDFGALVMKLIRKMDLSVEESRSGWKQIIQNVQPDLQQGAFMAALAAKGETSAEISGAWEAIYQHDTEKVDLSHLDPLVENCGTGMDTLKTFNISTAASLVAAAANIKMAKHGARAITSKCGSVDVLEALGVDVECPLNLVCKSIEESGIGIFNGMSARVHPAALGRILSQIRFGTSLNISGSLANPANPRYAVRGVFAPHLVENVAQTMRNIGFKKAMVFYGYGSENSAGMDELSTLGKSVISELKVDGSILSYPFFPEEIGITRGRFEQVASSNQVETDAITLLNAIAPRSNDSYRAQKDIVCLNAAPILLICDKVRNLKEGFQMACEIIKSGKALAKLRAWVLSQNSNPDRGLRCLDRLLEAVG